MTDEPKYVDMIRYEVFPNLVYDVEATELLDETLEILDLVTWLPSQDRTESCYVLRKYGDLTKKFESLVNDAVMECQYDVPFQMTTSWYTQQPLENGIVKHHHTNSFLATTYYMHDNCGQLTFHKDVHGIQVPYSRDPEEDVPVPDGRFSVPCKKGHLLIFPSALTHGVDGRFAQTTAMRYSLAMNYMPQGVCSHADSSFEYL